MPTNGIDILAKLAAVRLHVYELSAGDRYLYFKEWSISPGNHWDISWDEETQSTKLSVYARVDNLVYYNKLFSIPFTELSTQEDLQRFIDLLKVMEVHSR